MLRPDTVMRTKMVYTGLCFRHLMSMLFNLIFIALKCHGIHAGTRFRLSAKRTSPFKSMRSSVYTTTGRRPVCISGINVGYTMFQGSMKSTGYTLHLPVYPLIPLQYVTVCHHLSNGLYHDHELDNQTCHHALKY
jgi:hypothetical protein